MKKHQVGDIVEFNTTDSDMMNMNGAKCEIVGYDEKNNSYVVKFIDPIVNVLADELKEIE